MVSENRLTKDEELELFSAFTTRAMRRSFLAFGYGAYLAKVRCAIMDAIPPRRVKAKPSPPAAAYSSN